MVSRAQGAMEYLMSYGWAILVVMIVGGAMWQLGVFNTGGSAPTATVFGAIKPLLATCFSSDGNLWTADGQGHGFMCQFVNNAGNNIEITNITFLVNGEGCYGMMLELVPLFDNDKSYWCIRSSMTGIDHSPLRCYDHRGSGPTIQCFPPAICTYPVEAGETFLVFARSIDNGIHDIGPCMNPVPGEPYDLFIDLTYSVDIDGITGKKHSSGNIRFTP